MSKWQPVILGDYCEITSSKRIFYSDYVTDGVPFYRSKEIIERQRGDDISEPLFISNEKYENIKSQYGVPQANDMLLTSVGTIGIAYIVKETDNFYFKDGNLTWFRNFSPLLSSQYLYYWISSVTGQGILHNTTIGSSQKALTISALKLLKIPLPPIEVQRKIADILSAYDDLIENNRKQIKLLEEATQRLYKEWFIDFRFPGYENTKIIDGIPEGWEKKKLEEVCPILTGKRDANFGSPDGEYLFFTCSQEPIKSATFSFDTSAVILAGNGDFNVKLYRGKFEAYQRTYVLSPQNSEMLFLLFGAVRTNMLDLTQKASGSTIKFLTRGLIASIEILLPDNSLLKQYNILSNSIQKKIEYLSDLIKYVTEVRNRLLPKLMNGELEGIL